MKKISSYKISAVIFDMDGVITNTMPDHYKAWHTALAEIGINVSKLDIYSREGQKGAQSVRELMELYGQKYSRTVADKFLKRKEEIFKQISRRRFITGSRSFIKGLAKKNFRLALVTGTSRHELHRILPDELYSLFESVITGSDVKIGKPHPEPYQKALKELKLEKHKAVVIENAPFGIASAKAAGLRCVALQTSLPAEHLKEADAVYKSFADLTANTNFLLN